MCQHAIPYCRLFADQVRPWVEFAIWTEQPTWGASLRTFQKDAKIASPIKDKSHKTPESAPAAGDLKPACDESSPEFLEAHIKVVLRGFDAVPEFFRAKDNDFRLVKSAFIAADKRCDEREHWGWSKRFVGWGGGPYLWGQRSGRCWSFPYGGPTRPVSWCDSSPSTYLDRS